MVALLHGCSCRGLGGVLLNVAHMVMASEVVVLSRGTTTWTTMGALDAVPLAVLLARSDWAVGASASSAGTSQICVRSLLEAMRE